jgi:hypothetical protein
MSLYFVENSCSKEQDQNANVFEPGAAAMQLSFLSYAAPPWHSPYKTLSSTRAKASELSYFTSVGLNFQAFKLAQARAGPVALCRGLGQH